MSISVTGSVVNPGEYSCKTDCTLQDALNMAGGLKETKNYQPTGVITIRKRTSGIASELLKTINFKKEPKVLEMRLSTMTIFS